MDKEVIMEFVSLDYMFEEPSYDWPSDDDLELMFDEEPKEAL